MDVVDDLYYGEGTDGVYADGESDDTPRGGGTGTDPTPVEEVPQDD